MMINKQDLSANHKNLFTLQIRINGHLTSRYLTRFEGFTIALQENGETVISGSIRDQAALLGLLKKIANLGIRLISIVCIKKNYKNNKTE